MDKQPVFNFVSAKQFSRAIFPGSYDPQCLAEPASRAQPAIFHSSALSRTIVCNCTEHGDPRWRQIVRSTSCLSARHSRQSPLHVECSIDAAANCRVPPSPLMAAGLPSSVLGGSASFWKQQQKPQLKSRIRAEPAP